MEFSLLFASFSQTDNLPDCNRRAWKFTDEYDLGVNLEMSLFRGILVI